MAENSQPASEKFDYDTAKRKLPGFIDNGKVDLRKTRMTLKGIKEYMRDPYMNGKKYANGAMRVCRFPKEKDDNGNVTKYCNEIFASSGTILQ